MVSTDVAPSSGIDVAGRRLDGPWVVVAFAVLVAALGLLVSQLVPVAVFAPLALAGIELPSLLAVGLSLVLVELVGFGGSTWVYLRLRDLNADYVGLRRPTLRDLGWMVGGTVLVVVAYFVYMSVAVALGMPTVRSGISLYGETEPTGLLLIAALSFVLIGPMEELFFRGIVQGTMREVLSANVAVPLASFVFAVIHFLTLTGPFVGQVVVIGSLFITSLVFGYAYERTGNLAVNAVIHGGYNAVLLVLAYLVFSSGLAPV